MFKCWSQKNAFGTPKTVPYLFRQNKQSQEIDWECKYPTMSGELGVTDRTIYQYFGVGPRLTRRDGSPHESQQYKHPLIVISKKSRS